MAFFAARTVVLFAMRSQSLLLPPLLNGSHIRPDRLDRTSRSALADEIVRKLWKAPEGDSGRFNRIFLDRDISFAGVNLASRL